MYYRKDVYTEACMGASGAGTNFIESFEIEEMYRNSMCFGVFFNKSV